MLFSPVQYAKDYYNSLPTKILPSIAQSGIFSLTVTLMFMRKDKGVNLVLLATNSAAAMLASTIHALLTPFFHEVFGDKLNFVYEFCKSSIVTVLTSLLIESGTTNSIDLVAFKIYTMISINSLYSFFDSKNAVGLTYSHNSVYIAC